MSYGRNLTVLGVCSPCPSSYSSSFLLLAFTFLIVLILVSDNRKQLLQSLNDEMMKYSDLVDKLNEVTPYPSLPYSSFTKFMMQEFIVPLNNTKPPILSLSEFQSIAAVFIVCYLTLSSHRNKVCLLTFAIDDCGVQQDLKARLSEDAGGRLM